MKDRPWVQHYDQGVPATIDYPKDFSVYKFFDQAVEQYPDKACTIFNGAEITYKEMQDLSDRLAAGLAGMGIKPGDRVGVFIPNTPQFVIAYLALLKLGAVVVATNPLYTEREIEYQVNDAGVEIMILMTNNYEKVKSIQHKTRIRQIIATNIKEALPPVLRVLFTLAREKKAGFRVTLRDNDVWMQDLIKNSRVEDRQIGRAHV